jgi:hypothetical protein
MAPIFIVSIAGVFIFSFRSHMRSAFPRGIPAAKSVLIAAGLGSLGMAVVACAGPGSPIPSTTLAVTRQAEAQGDWLFPDRFTFSFGGFQYSATADGAGVRSVAGSTDQRFQLPLDRGTRIQRFWYLPVEHDVVLIYEYSDDESAAGTVVRLTGQNLQSRWSAFIPGFNIGEGVMEDEHLYITAIGFVGKLNLRTGQYAWTHKNLYADGRFNDFKRPVVGDTVVTFTDGSNTIVIDKRTGARVH